MSATVRTLAQARKSHGLLDVGAKVFPVHFEKTPRGYKQTDRAHCVLCGQADKDLEIARLKARIAELEGRK